MAGADSSGPAAGPSNGECCAQDAGAARASAPAVQQPGPPSSHAAAAAGGEDPSQPSQSSAADGSTDTAGPATSSNDGGSGSSSAGGGAAAAGGGSPRGSAFAQTPPDDAECRICLLPEPAGLVEPCSCTGTLRYAHLGCLVRWCKERVSTHCEVGGVVGGCSCQRQVGELSTLNNGLGDNAMAIVSLERPNWAAQSGQLCAWIAKAVRGWARLLSCPQCLLCTLCRSAAHSTGRSCCPCWRRRSKRSGSSRRCGQGD